MQKTNCDLVKPTTNPDSFPTCINCESENLRLTFCDTIKLNSKCIHATFQNSIRCIKVHATCLALRARMLNIQYDTLYIQPGYHVVKN